MPAQWPLFINNLSNKLSSRSIGGPDQFGEFVANEYFNAVKTSQTPFGNIHSSGQKTILVEGFKKAFNKLFDSVEPALEDKEKNPLFADFFEPFPPAKPLNDTEKEFKKWLTENDVTIPDFLFYEFIEDPNEGKEDTQPDLFGNIGASINNQKPEITFVGINGVAPYTFTYKINGKLQPGITTLEGDSVTVICEEKPGNIEYELVDVRSSNSDRPIKIGQKLIINLSEVDPSSITIQTPEPVKPVSFFKNMAENDRVINVAKRVLAQNDGSAEFVRWVKRLEYGVNSAFGKNVKEKVLAWIENKTKFTLKLNKNYFQREFEDDKDFFPEWMNGSTLICKFVYKKEIDALSSLQQSAFLASDIFSNPNSKENNRINAKYPHYKIEKERFKQLREKWIQDMADKAKTGEEATDENDPYSIMAGAIVAYWMSTTVKPFQSAPPVPPCLIPTPGTFIPISYGFKSKLTKDLRRAWNTGKSFKAQPTLQAATKATATAVAVACAKHLKDLKFIYSGQIYVGVSTAPMIGFVPTVF